MYGAAFAGLHVEEVAVEVSVDEWDGFDVYIVEVALSGYGNDKTVVLNTLFKRVSGLVVVAVFGVCGIILLPFV